ncbi:MAG TPA: hypothetical protein VK548_10950 [Candidatus Acidoferrum sp.]|nr:hypothetical protein [Candidatus Acidoferrum sp.]
MRTSFVIGLVVALSVLIGVVGPAAADSFGHYLDGSESDVFNLGGGGYALVFYNDLNPPEIYIHAFNSFANLLLVSLLGVNGYVFHLQFEGVTQGGFDQYGVYACTGFSNQICNVSGVRRGTLFL